MTGAELREKFLTYFEQRGHTRVASSSLLPEGDATLLFVNAGMVQFKGIFTGMEKRPYVRATTAQKCLRVSGKHNDLENVGHTARHHTFFEMMGNFSFGDYFKEDAIAFGWEFLTKVVGLPKKQLHVTIYKDDDEAAEIWKKVLGPGANPIERLGEKDNFWSMGDTGPCGPCSEIHIDQGSHLGCGNDACGPECDCDRFLELWNLVFMQFERDASGKMTPLPKPSIDTGLGLERLAAVVQGKESNWESDLFNPLIHQVEELSGKRCRGQDLEAVAIRVIADHSRAAAFLIADGVLPSNEGRGYVLRRILRRALRYGKFIGLNEPFLFDTARVVINQMSGAYPELDTHRVLVKKVILHEEERFLDTLARGLVLFEEEAGRVKNTGGSILPGKVAFRLYDTFGFPLDLTADLAGEAGLAVDQAGFDKEMARQRELARQSWEGMHGEGKEGLAHLLEQGIETEFTGYETLEDSGTVRAMLKDGVPIDEAREGWKVEVLTDRTPFYGESGGQVGDRGLIRSNGNEMEVEDTIKPVPALIIHKGFVRSGTLRLGDRVGLKVESQLRRATMANHSATHILQWALRRVLGEHVSQRGSVVDPSRLRFDFTHFSAMTDEEVQHVEDLVNEKIWDNVEIQARSMPIDEARAQGAIALFGEKYGEIVRLVSIGDFSREFCGGTHARRTGDIGMFKIVKEGGIAAGVRRIEAVTQSGLLGLLRTYGSDRSHFAKRLKAGDDDLRAKLDKLIEEKKSLERELETQKRKQAGNVTGDLLDGVRDVKGVRVLTRLVDDVSTPKDLRDYADRVRDRLGSGIALLGAKGEDKALLLAIVSKDLTKQYHAGHIVQKAAAMLGGSGGGRPDMAQAGGPDIGALDEALKSVENFLGN